MIATSGNLATSGRRSTTSTPIPSGAVSANVPRIGLGQAPVSTKASKPDLTKSIANRFPKTLENNEAWGGMLSVFREHEMTSHA